MTVIYFADDLETGKREIDAGFDPVAEEFMNVGWQSEADLRHEIIASGREPVGQAYAPNARYADMAQPRYPKVVAIEAEEPITEKYLIHQMAEQSRASDQRLQRLLMGIAETAADGF